MSSIIVKQYNGTSYTELTPKESINSDTVDNYHASELIQKAISQSVEYTNLKIGKLQNGKSFSLSASATFIFGNYTGRYVCHENGNGWDVSFDLSNLRDELLIRLNNFSLLEDEVASSKFRTSLGTFTIKLNSQEYSYQTFEQSPFCFGFPSCDLVNWFNQTVSKTDKLSASFRVTDDSYYGNQYYYHYVTAIPTQPVIITNDFGKVLK